MANLNKIKELAIQLMSKEFDVVIKTSFCIQTYTLSALNLGYRFEYSNTKRVFGTCNYMTQIITLSKPICEANLDKIDTQVTNTILHEIAHAFCIHIYGVLDGRGHDWKWRDIATQIGCSGDRCYTYEDVNAPTSKYTLECKSCGNTTPKFKKPTKKQACGKCCRKHNFGKFSHDYVLELKINY
jgi:predicted SprT family Zn-dependent metalloprotease